jgi:hypothetical protein
MPKLRPDASVDNLADLRELDNKVQKVIAIAKARKLQKLRADPGYVTARAEAVLADLHPTIAELAPGTVIVIDLVTGAFVTAPSRSEGLDAFERRFGAGQTMGWLHQVGGGVVLGGGIA